MQEPEKWENGTHEGTYSVVGYAYALAVVFGAERVFRTRRSCIIVV